MNKKNVILFGVATLFIVPTIQDVIRYLKLETTERNTFSLMERYNNNSPLKV